MIEINNQSLPEEIKEVFWFIRHTNSLDALLMRQAQKKIDTFQKYLASQFDYFFPKSKHCTESAIGNHIFKLSYNQRDAKTVAKYELAGLISTVGKSVADLKELVKNENFLLAFHELKLIGAYASDSVEIIEKASTVNGVGVKYDFSRRNVLDSVEAFKLSRYLLGGLVADELENRAASVFLIRQALELKMKNALGVHSVISESGIEKFTGFVFVNIIKENIDSIEIPLDFKIFQKIVDWTNASIHSGWVPPAWKIDWAHNYLEPLFESGSNRTIISSYGAIKIKKDFLVNIESILQKFLRSKDKKIQDNIRAGTHNRPDKYDGLKIVNRRPESILMDDLE